MVAIATLLILSGIFNALMDLSSENKLIIGNNTELYKWLNKDWSWKNKYKNNNPVYGEKFLGSTTVFVFLTDGWHLFQFLFHTCWQLAVSLYFDRWFVAFILIKILFSGTFQLFYSTIKKRK